MAHLESRLRFPAIRLDGGVGGCLIQSLVGSSGQRPVQFRKLLSNSELQGDTATIIIRHTGKIYVSGSIRRCFRLPV